MGAQPVMHCNTVAAASQSFGAADCPTCGSCQQHAHIVPLYELAHQGQDGPVVYVLVG